MSITEISKMDLWLQLDEAFILGFIRRLEEVTKPNGRSITNKPHVGTRIIFDMGIPHKKVEKVAEHIKKTYNLEVELQFPFSIVVWEPLK